MTAAASLVALAGHARPGDVLYGLKRGTEQTQLALAGDARGQTLLDFASTRLSELQELVDQPTALPAAGAADASDGTLLAAGADPELVISTLETMDDQTTEGTAWLTDRARDDPLRRTAGRPGRWVAAQTNGLASLAPDLPSAAGAAVAHSQALLSDVSARTNGLQAALTCGSGPSVGPDDALGPVPAPACPRRVTLRHSRATRVPVRPACRAPPRSDGPAGRRRHHRRRAGLRRPERRHGNRRRNPARRRPGADHRRDPHQAPGQHPEHPAHPRPADLGGAECDAPGHPAERAVHRPAADACLPPLATIPATAEPPGPSPGGSRRPG